MACGGRFWLGTLQLDFSYPGLGLTPLDFDLQKPGFLVTMGCDHYKPILCGGKFCTDFAVVVMPGMVYRETFMCSKVCRFCIGKRERCIQRRCVDVHHLDGAHRGFCDAGEVFIPRDEHNPLDLVVCNETKQSGTRSWVAIPAIVVEAIFQVGRPAGG